MVKEEWKLILSSVEVLDISSLSPMNSAAVAHDLALDLPPGG